MTDNIDSLFKDGLEKVKPGAEMMQQDWEAMKSLLLTVHGHNGKPNGNIIGKKIFFAISIASVVLVAVYLLLSNKKTIQQNVTTATIKASTPVPKQFSQPQKKDTSLILTSGNIAKNKTDNSPKPNFIQVDTTRVKDTAQQDSSTAISMDNSVAKPKTDAEILDSFYNLLKTPTQVFVIDNTKDTTIVAKEGSEIVIPSNCFTTEDAKPFKGTVTILVEEYYSYADIVPHKLYTMSDTSALVSGGMLHITALAQNKNLQLAKNKQLFAIMPTKNYDKDMQLFLEKKCQACDTTKSINWEAVWNENLFGDRVDDGINYPKPHWIQLFPFNWRRRTKTYLDVPAYIWRSKSLVKVLNLKNDPFRVSKHGNKIIAKFKVTNTCSLTDEQITAELKKRYPAYSEIKIKKTSNPHSYFFKEEDEDVYRVIGDSILVTPKEADQKALWTKDEKAAYYKKYGQKLKTDSVQYTSINMLEKSYSFNISNLGWINCDHFYNDPREKIRYVLDIKDTTRKYISQLIFLNCRLMMPAEIYKNYISFPSIPIGEQVQLVSIGVKKGKIVASLQKFTVSKEVVNDVSYQEIGAEDLKKQLRLSDIK